MGLLTRAGTRHVLMILMTFGSTEQRGDDGPRDWPRRPREALGVLWSLGPAGAHLQLEGLRVKGVPVLESDEGGSPRMEVWSGAAFLPSLIVIYVKSWKNFKKTKRYQHIMIRKYIKVLFKDIYDSRKQSDGKQRSRKASALSSLHGFGLRQGGCCTEEKQLRCTHRGAWKVSEVG